MEQRRFGLADDHARRGTAGDIPPQGRELPHRRGVQPQRVVDAGADERFEVEHATHGNQALHLDTRRRRSNNGRRQLGSGRVTDEVDRSGPAMLLQSRGYGTDASSHGRDHIEDRPARREGVADGREPVSLTERCGRGKK